MMVHVMVILLQMDSSSTLSVDCGSSGSSGSCRKIKQSKITIEDISIKKLSLRFLLIFADRVNIDSSWETKDDANDDDDVDDDSSDVDDGNHNDDDDNENNNDNDDDDIDKDCADGRMSYARVVAKEWSNS